MQRGAMEALTVKVDRLMRAHDLQFEALIHQYDQIISRPNISPDVQMRAIEAKTRLLTAISDNASRIALAVQRDRKLVEEQNRTKAIDRSSAIRLIDHNRKVQNNPIDIDPAGATRPPKVRMYEVDDLFKATVGLPEMDMPEPT